MPGVQLPTQPSNQTMVIGTPPGYKDRPPRKLWPIVLILVVLAAGGGVAVAMMMRHGSTSSASSAPDDDVKAAVRYITDAAK